MQIFVFGSVCKIYNRVFEQFLCLTTIHDLELETEKEKDRERRRWVCACERERECTTMTHSVQDQKAVQFNCTKETDDNNSKETPCGHLTHRHGGNGVFYIPLSTTRSQKPDSDFDSSA